MPNHIHAIIIISNNAITLGKFVRDFKSKVSRKYNKKFNLYNTVIWQRNYYEHIIRNEFDLQRIKNYIKSNPIKWVVK